MWSAVQRSRLKRINLAQIQTKGAKKFKKKKRSNTKRLSSESIYLWLKFDDVQSAPANMQCCGESVRLKAFVRWLAHNKI